MMLTNPYDKEDKVVEVDIHPISKWRRMLVYLGDMFISFIVAVLFMNVAVMPICSAINTTNAQREAEAEYMRNDILYENKLLFYRSEVGSKYPKHNFDANLTYTFNRFLAYYVFPDDTSLDPDYPEYCHLQENEVIYTYYNNIRSDLPTYINLFTNHNKDKKNFEINGNVVTLKTEVINEVRIFFKPGESLGSKGQEYYNQISDLFSALYGCVMNDILEKDLTDSKGNSFVKYQQIIAEINENYYKTIAVCGAISFVISWACVHILYPLINKDNHTPTMSIMKVDRLGYRNLMPLSKGETALTAAYFLLFDLPYIMFLSLSYMAFIYILKVPVLPLLSIISTIAVIIGMFIIIFNPFNRSAVDLLSQSVMISSEEVDGIIKTKELIQEMKIANNKKEKDNA